MQFSFNVSYKDALERTVRGGVPRSPHATSPSHFFYCLHNRHTLFNYTGLWLEISHLKGDFSHLDSYLTTSSCILNGKKKNIATKRFKMNKLLKIHESKKKNVIKIGFLLKEYHFLSKITDGYRLVNICLNYFMSSQPAIMWKYMSKRPRCSN